MSLVVTDDDGEDDGAYRWQDFAFCRGMDPNLFFPTRGATDEDFAAPKRVCAQCPVREDCLEHALRNGERFGVWGGANERERERMRRRRRRSA